MSPQPPQPKLAIGGAVNPRKQVYITREDIELEVIGTLQRLEYLNILSSRQVGKTSLTYKAAMALQENGFRVVLIDVSSIGAPVDPAIWFRDLLMQVRDQLDLRSFDLRTWWREHDDESFGSRIVSFFREHIVKNNDAGPVVVFVDEIDSTLKLPYTDDFFTAIRSMYNQRPSTPCFERLSFCLIGVATPNELIKDRRTTSYNVGRSVELRDFVLGKDDLKELERYFASHFCEHPERLIADILGWTGGHPYLTILLCSEYASHQNESTSVTSLVHRRFKNISTLRTDVHFEQILRFLDHRLSRSDETLDIYANILRGKRVEDRSTAAQIELRLAGLVKRTEDGGLEVRNRIYRRIFDQHWLKGIRPNKVRRRLKVFAAASLCITLCVVGLFIYNFPEMRRAQILGELDSKDLPDALAEIDKYYGLPLPPSEFEVRTWVEKKIDSGFSETSDRELSEDIRRTKLLLSDEVTFLRVLDDRLYKNASELLGRKDWENKLSRLSIFVDGVGAPDKRNGLVADLLNRTDQRLKSFYNTDVIRNVTDQAEIQSLFADLESFFPSLSGAFSPLKEDFLARIGTGLISANLAEASNAKSESKIGETMYIEGEFIAPSDRKQPFWIGLYEEDSEDIGIRFSFVITNQPAEKYALQISIDRCGPLDRKLHRQCDAIVETEVGAKHQFRIVRSGSSLSLAVGEVAMTTNLLFRDYDRTRRITFQAGEDWGVKAEQTPVRYLPKKLSPYTMEVADKTFFRSEFRSAAELYQKIQSNSSSKAQRAEAQLKKAICVSKLHKQSAATIQELLDTFLPELNIAASGSVPNNPIDLVWDRLGRLPNNPYASYAIYLLLLEQVERSGLEWESNLEWEQEQFEESPPKTLGSPHIKIAAAFEQLKLLTVGAEPQFIPADLWDVVLQKVRGTATNQIEQLKLTERDAETYRLILQFCKYAPLAVEVELRYYAAQANLYIGHRDAIRRAYEYASDLVARPHLGGVNRLRILYEYVWASNLMDSNELATSENQAKHNRLALAKTDELKARSPNAIGYIYDVYLSQILLNLAGREDIDKATLLLDHVLGNLDTSSGENEQIDASKICHAYLMRGYIAQLRNQESEAERLWYSGFEYGLTHKLAASDLDLVILGSLCRQIDGDFAEQSFKRNLESGGFAAAGILLSLIKTQMQDISIAMRDMYSTPPGTVQFPKLMLHQVPRDEFLIIQGELGMLHVIRKGAFGSVNGDAAPPDLERDQLILDMSRSGLEAFCDEKLQVQDMINLVNAWTLGWNLAPVDLPPSVQHEFCYVWANRLINQKKRGALRRIRELLDFAAKAESPRTQRLANAALSELPESPPAIE